MYLLFAVLYIPGEGFRPHQQQQTVGLPGRHPGTTRITNFTTEFRKGRLISEYLRALHGLS